MACRVYVVEGNGVRAQHLGVRADPTGVQRFTEL